MLVTMTPGEPVTCSEHGELSPPGGSAAALALTRLTLRAMGLQTEGDADQRLVAGVTGLLHLRDVHGKDVDGAIRQVLAQVQREAHNGQPDA
jgi:hypothetical protein